MPNRRRFVYLIRRGRAPTCATRLMSGDWTYRPASRGVRGAKPDCPSHNIASLITFDISSIFRLTLIPALPVPSGMTTIFSHTKDIDQFSGANVYFLFTFYQDKNYGLMINFQKCDICRPRSMPYAMCYFNKVCVCSRYFKMFQPSPHPLP